MITFHSACWDTTPPARRPPARQTPPCKETLPGKADTTPPGQADPPGKAATPWQGSPCTVHAGRYGQQAGGMHPTRMQFLLKLSKLIYSRCKEIFKMWWKKTPHICFDNTENEYSYALKILAVSVFTARNRVWEGNAPVWEGNALIADITKYGVPIIERAWWYEAFLWAK